MSDHLSDAIFISATAPAQVTAEGEAVDMTDAIIDGVVNSSGTVRNKRTRSLGSIDNDESEDIAVVSKKLRGRRPKTANANPTVVPKSDKLHGRKPKEIESRTGSDNSSNSSCTAIKSLHGKNSAISAPGTAVAPTDYERIDKIVSERVAAELSTKLLPLTQVMNMMQKELQSVKETMERMSSIISKLSNSSFAATVTTIDSAQQQDRQPGRSDSTEPNLRKPTYAAAAASERGIAQSPQHHRSQQSAVRNSRKQYEPQQQATQEAVTAMYVDQKRKQQRANNIIISGLQASENDVMTVTEMLRSEFEWDAAEWPGISVSKCRRLGKPQENKNQLLLVTLDSSDQASYYIKNARILRHSNEKAIRENVYINADLTPPEARAAYELRIQRRQR